ncbi:MAG: YihY/virulence factor BrkB family protein [Bryobacteraceae bacterium]|nr:YihY/virulence factor BrkB family protein [Bryobacteraceae bacterium]
MKDFWRRLGRAAWAVYLDGCLGYSKGAAYSALVAFIPLLTTTLALLVQANAPAVSRGILDFLFTVVPPGTEDIFLKNYLTAGSRPVSLIVIAGIVSVWAASGVMMSLMEGFHAAYRVPDRRNFWSKRGTAIGLVFATVVPAVLASLFVLLGEIGEAFVLRALGVLDAREELRGGVALLGRLLRYSTSIITVILVTTLLYHHGVDHPTRFRRVWSGALVATTLWMVATQLFAWYVRNIADYNLLYGSIGAAIALTGWLYILAVIALYGAEYNAEIEREEQGRYTRK